MLQKNYIRERHYYPTVPTQESLLLPYSDDTPENVKTLNRLYNLFTNFEGSEIFDDMSPLPPMYGISNTHYTSDKKFDIIDLTGNILTIGPGIAIMGDTIVDVTGNTNIDLVSNDSWHPPIGLDYSSYFVYPPTLDFTGSELDVVVSLFKFEDSTNTDAVFMVSTPYAFVSSLDFTAQAVPIHHLKLTLDSSDNITSYEAITSASHIGAQDPELDPEPEFRHVKYKSFPHFKLFKMDGGHPSYG